MHGSALAGDGDFGTFRGSQRDVVSFCGGDDIGDGLSGVIGKLDALGRPVYRGAADHPVSVRKRLGIAVRQNVFGLHAAICRNRGGGNIILGELCMDSGVDRHGAPHQQRGQGNHGGNQDKTRFRALDRTGRFFGFCQSGRFQSANGKEQFFTSFHTAYPS